MDLSPEQKINMSLESLIAAKQQNTKQKRDKKNSGNDLNTQSKKETGGLVITKPRRLAGKARVTNTGNNSNNQGGGRGKARGGSRPNSAGSNQTNNTNVSSVKVAKSVGTTKANRNASINQRRGLNNTGKASKMEVDKEVKKQLNRNKPAAVGGIPCYLSVCCFRYFPFFSPSCHVAVGNAARRRSGGGLKITFKPSELPKTTDRQVSQQIRAVLSRQSPRAGSGGGGGNQGNQSGGNTPRKGNAGPKVRAKNTVLQVNR
jgi:hypothetical protein